MFSEWRRVGVGSTLLPVNKLRTKLFVLQIKNAATNFFGTRRTRYRRSYIQGLSTSLPEDVQKRLSAFYWWTWKCWIDANFSVMRLNMLWLCHISFSCYLKSKKISGLFASWDIWLVKQRGKCCRDQCSSKNSRKPELISFGNAVMVILVMIDDLVTKGTVEPYRLWLVELGIVSFCRQSDNADMRLTEIGRKVDWLMMSGCVWIKKHQYETWNEGFNSY